MSTRRDSFWMRASSEYVAIAGTDVYAVCTGREVCKGVSSECEKCDDDGSRVDDLVQKTGFEGRGGRWGLPVCGKEGVTV